MKDGHLAALGSLFDRGLRWLRFLILDLILIRFFRPERGCRPPFGDHGICRHGSFLAGSRGYAGIGQGPVLAQPCPATGAEIRLPRKLLPAVMTELGNYCGFFMDRLFIDRLFIDRLFADVFMDFRSTERFFGFLDFRFHNRTPHNMFGDIPSCRADLGMFQGFQGTFHGNLHGRLDFGFFYGGNVVTGCRWYLAFRIRCTRSPSCGFRYLPDLGTPRRGNGLFFR